MEKSPETWVREIHENAVAHGWWIEDRDFGEICALIHSELSEALEEYRNARPLVYYHCGAGGSICDPQACADIHRDPIYAEEPCDDRKEKPEGIAVELADVVIRIFDHFGYVDYAPRWNILYPAEFMRELTDTHGVAFNEMIRAVEYRAISEATEKEGTYRSFGDFISCCHADISQAYSAIEGRYPDEFSGMSATSHLLSCVARIGYWFAFKKLDIETVIAEKHEYNKSRPYRHGGKKL